MKDIRKVRWELAKKMRKGKIFYMKPTMVCNLKCPYCSVNKAHGRAPRFHDMHYGQWLDTILAYDKNIKQVTISGGEPALYTDIVPLVNSLINMRYIVLIFSNLSKIDKFLEIRKSWRLAFYSTYHNVLDLDTYLENYNILNKRFYVSVRELRPPDDMKPVYIPWAKVKPISDKQDDDYVEIFSPDGRMFYSCQSLDKAGE